MSDENKNKAQALFVGMAKGTIVRFTIRQSPPRTVLVKDGSRYKTAKRFMLTIWCKYTTKIRKQV